ncbi:MAG: hypothetical protein K6G50_01460 [bacterium]|nr:hypothetical protein [bacterium]
MNSLTGELLEQYDKKSHKSKNSVRLIIAVLGFEKMINPEGTAIRVVAGEHQIRVGGAYRASLVGRIHNLLESLELEVLGIEQTGNDESFALLIHAEYEMKDSASFTALRKKLEDGGKKLGVSLRVQREELFSYMHRI